MIKTHLTTDDAKKIIELGRRLHDESKFKSEPYDELKCWGLLESTVVRPDKRFIAYNEDFTGFIIVGIQESYFSEVKHAVDYGLFIVPEARGGSLVVRLVNEATKWAFLQGAKDLTIFHNTGIQTDKAPKLFNKLGFDMNGYIFTKDLQTCAD